MLYVEEGKEQKKLEQRARSFENVRRTVESNGLEFW